MLHTLVTDRLHNCRGIASLRYISPSNVKMGSAENIVCPIQAEMKRRSQETKSLHFSLIISPSSISLGRITSHNEYQYIEINVVNSVNSDNGASKSQVKVNRHTNE